MKRPFSIFTAEDFKELMGPGQGGPAIDTWCTFTSLTADLLAQQANRILNERGTRVLGKEFQFDKFEPFTVWKEKPDSVDKVASKYEALLLGQRRIEK